MKALKDFVECFCGLALNVYNFGDKIVLIYKFKIQLLI